MSVTVLSYNIEMGGEDRLPEITGVIRSRQPDAVALLEAMRQDMAADLARALGMELVFGEANNGFHVAWLSRLPIRHWENHRLSALAKTLLEIEVDWEDTPIRLFATHLASRHDETTPANEVPAILEVLRPPASTPHLLAGDFNALRPNDPVGIPPPGVTRRGDAADHAPRHAIGQILDAGYVDCYRALHPGTPGYTYPSSAPWLRLDYIFASPELAARLKMCDIITGDDVVAASDHLPILATFGSFRPVPRQERPPRPETPD